jgi:DNA-binding Lrp family transcriptional regulator
LNLDGTDYRILAELVENSKQSYVEIGRKLALHPNVIAYRVNRLEDQGIIREYTTLVDFSKLGLPEQVVVAANFPSDSSREDIMKQICEIPETVNVISSLGSRSMNLDIDFASSVIRTYDEGRLGTYFRAMAGTDER